MTLSDSEYRAKAALLALARQMQMLQRNAEKEKDNVAAKIIAEVAHGCLEDIQAAINSGKNELPALNCDSAKSFGAILPQSETADLPEADAAGWIVSPPTPAGPGINMASLVTLRADFEKLKRKTDKEFGPYSDPSQLLSRGIATLSHRLNRYFTHFR